MTVADGGAPAADVVEAEAGDLAALVDLHALCFGEALSRDAIAGVLGAPGAFGLIACSGGRAAGFVLVRAVMRAARGRRVAGDAPAGNRTD